MMGKKGVGFLCLLLAAATAVFAAFSPPDPTYIVTDGQTEVEIVGRYETVADLLNTTNIILRTEDIVIPHLESQPLVNQKIEVVRARSVTVRHGNQTQAHWTQQTNLQNFFEEVGITPQPGDAIFADGQPISIAHLHTHPLPQYIEIGQATSVTILDDSKQQVVFTTGNTVADALLEAEIPIDSSIIVSPSLTAPLQENMTIALERGFDVTILVDGRSITTRTGATTTQQILAEAEVTLSALDYTRPPLDAPLSSGDTIQVVRVVEESFFEEDEIPYQTVWQGTDTLDLDTQAVISYGQVGIFQRQTKIRYENGVEVSQTVVTEGIVQEPINEVIGYGTKITINTVNTPQGPREYWRVVQMRVTSYTAATSGRDPDDPAYGITASGLPAGFGVVAIDRNVVPFRSEVFVPGYGVAIAGDTGGGVRGRWIDLGYDEDTFQSWSGYVDVYYLTPVPTPDNINYILPAGLP